MKEREPQRSKRRRPYRPPRVTSERTFEQNTLACGKTSADIFVQACVDNKAS